MFAKLINRFNEIKRLNTQYHNAQFTPRLKPDKYKKVRSEMVELKAKAAVAQAYNVEHGNVPAFFKKYGFK